MSDLFSGRSALTPWIEPVVYDAILQQLHSRDVHAVERRPKVVQVVQVGASFDSRGVPLTLHLSDGATSIVAALSQLTREALKLDVDCIVPGCVVRIHEWQVMVEPSSPTECPPMPDLLRRDALVQTLAVSSAAIVYLQIKNAVVPLGGRGLAVSGPPTPILETIDVRRALFAMENGGFALPDEPPPPLNQPLVAQSVTNVQHAASANVLVGDGAARVGRATASIPSKVVALSISPAMPALDNLPLGDVAALLKASHSSAGVAGAIHRAGDSLAPAISMMPIGDVSALFGCSGGSSSILAEVCAVMAAPTSNAGFISTRTHQEQRVTTASKRTLAPPKMPTVSSKTALTTCSVLFPAISTTNTLPIDTAQHHTDEVMLDDTSSDEEEGQESLGIGNMLVDPDEGDGQTEGLPQTQKIGTSQTPVAEALAVEHEEGNDSADISRIKVRDMKAGVAQFCHPQQITPNTNLATEHTRGASENEDLETQEQREEVEVVDDIAKNAEDHGDSENEDAFGSQLPVPDPGLPDRRCTADASVVERTTKPEDASARSKQPKPASNQQGDAIRSTLFDRRSTVAPQLASASKYATEESTTDIGGLKSPWDALQPVGPSLPLSNHQQEPNLPRPAVGRRRVQDEATCRLQPKAKRSKQAFRLGGDTLRSWLMDC